LVLLDQALNPTDLNRPETAAAFEANGVEPEFCGVLASFDMNVRRLHCVAGVEVKAIRPRPQHRRHRPTLPDLEIAMIFTLSLPNYKSVTG
jgi:hypothetical protein